MVTIDHPHMGLNDPRAPVTISMWNTWQLTQTDTKNHIIDWVAEVAHGVKSGQKLSVVFNCHGNSSYLQMGEGFGSGDTGLFTRWQGLVFKVWFRACLVASGDTGNRFCSEIAKNAKCYVVASTELQAEYANRSLPYGQLDTFEGELRSYGPDGVVSWSHKYASTTKDASGNWTRNAD